MQELILLLSRCLCKCTVKKNGLSYSKFHFKGHYKGQKIISIETLQTNIINFENDEDYLLWIKADCVKNGVLNAVVIKAKKID